MERKFDFYREIFFIFPNRVRYKPVGPRRERGRTPSESLCLPSIGAPNPELGPYIERLNSVDWVIGARNFNIHWAIPAQQFMCITPLLVSLAIVGHLLASKRGKFLASA
jgi:hypothetical protein